MEGKGSLNCPLLLKKPLIFPLNNIENRSEANWSAALTSKLKKNPFEIMRSIIFPPLFPTVPKHSLTFSNYLEEIKKESKLVKVLIHNNSSICSGLLGDQFSLGPLTRPNRACASQTCILWFVECTAFQLIVTNSSPQVSWFPENIDCRTSRRMHARWKIVVKALEKE